MEELRTFLSEVGASNTKTTRVGTAAGETGIDEASVQVVFSELSAEGALRAKVEVRCPYCATHHGTFERKSAVPSGSKDCFVCGNEFETSSRRNWEVVYEIADDTADFFPDNEWRIQRYLKSHHELPPSVLQDELKRLQNMDDHQERGRQFDYYVGLLFQQLEGVEVRIKTETITGEVDVFVSCRQAADSLRRLVGSGTIVENKWQKDPVQKKEVDNFHSKARDLAFPCYMVYFVSMSGFTSGKDGGALSQLRNCENPRVIDFDSEDVEDMAREGSPISKIRERELA